MQVWFTIEAASCNNVKNSLQLVKSRDPKRRLDADRTEKLELKPTFHTQTPAIREALGGTNSQVHPLDSRGDCRIDASSMASYD